jgi:DNA polymerase-3 subunit delta'
MSQKTDSPKEKEEKHPRYTYELFGHQETLSLAASVIRTGGPPGGWLVSGPPGVGKATFAYRIARYLLMHGANDGGAEDLSVASDQPVSRQIESESHPGLLVLTRGIDSKGKTLTTLTVDVIRRIDSFFGLTSGAGGWRVAIVDGADYMNDSAANALLKRLEEPPMRATLILVASAPARLLPTIRSRCQQLHLRPLKKLEMSNALTRILPDIDSKILDLVIELSEGSPGLALKLVEGEGLKLAENANNLINSGAPDFPALFALADQIAKLPDGPTDFGQHLSNAIARHVRNSSFIAEEDYRGWVEAWERVNQLFSRAMGVHMEPRQTVINSARIVDNNRRHNSTV